MKENLKSLRYLVLIVAIAYFAAPFIANAAGHIGVSEVVSELRTQTFSAIMQVPSTAESNADTTPGNAGVAVAAAYATSVSVAATSINGLPYPCKLLYQMKDNGANATLACTSLTLTGINQFGLNVREVFTDLTETSHKTNRVYGRLDTVVATGCTDGSGTTTGDTLRVACSAEVGLPMKPTTSAGLLRACLFDNSVTNAAYCFRPTDMRAAYDSDDYSVNCDGFTGTTPSTLTLARGDICQVKVRPPYGL